MFDLTGRTAIVTGGNGGIGLGMAEGLARAGARIAVAARNMEKSLAAVEQLRTLGGEADAFTVDVPCATSCRTMVAHVRERFGSVDILVNNAGINIRKQPEDYEPEEWQAVIDVNLTGAFLCCQAAFPHMRDAGRGKIINIGSMMSIFGAPFTGPYASSKGGIVQMTRALASAWARHGIQVNAVLPGWIDTELTRASRREVDGLHERVLARTPAGRWGVAGDLAGIAVFLAAPESDFVTGTAIPVDGGYSVQA